MAGRYFYDPRPFYNQLGIQQTGYKSLDEAFKKETKGAGDKKNQDGEKEGGESKKGEEGKKKGEDKSKTIELMVNLCCDNCEWKVKDILEDVEGVEKVDCCQWTKKVTVKGFAKPEYVLQRVKKVKNDAIMWPKAKQN